ncbi:ankyrin repeat [Fusarium longipes]|uniref:Ankyrin repeat n=1 Tax=Fusarium longipes TaxID=694270 RepID=A0A395SMP9_9HYPO|nr:ankyrin repeat [Fusarium longipes]
MSEPEKSGLGSSAQQDIVNLASTEQLSEQHSDEESNSQEDDEDVISDVSSELSEIPDIATFIDPKPPLFGSQTRPIGLNRPWGLTNYDDFDVVTVHGLRDDHKTVWRSQTGKLWIRGQLFDGLAIRQLDYLYSNDQEARIFSHDGIKTEARNLLRQYREYRLALPDTEVDRPIIWICHDIGGTIVKQVLIEAAQAVMLEDYKDIAAWDSAKAIHHRVVTLSTTMDEIFNLLNLPGPPITNGGASKVKRIARQVEEINLRFLRSKLFHRPTIINVYHLLDLPDEISEGEPKNEEIASAGQEESTEDGDCDTTEPGVKQDDRGSQHTLVKDATHALAEFPVAPPSPFSRYTIVTFGLTETHSRFLEPDIDHLNLVKGDENSDDDCNWVVLLAKRFRENLYPIRVDYAFVRYQMALLTLMPPMRIPTVHMEFGDRYKLPIIDWITAQDAYKTMTADLCPQILYVQTNETDSSRTSMLSQYMYTACDCEHVDPWGENPTRNAFYFEFVKHDDRFNNIRSMLLTFINHAAWNHYFTPDLYEFQYMLPQLEEYHSWSPSQLFRVFSNFRFWTKMKHLTMFLGCFENCIEEDRRWFLAALKEDHARLDMDYRVVIITDGPDEISRAFIPESQVLSLEECPIPVLGWSIDEAGKSVPELKKALDDAIRKRPVLGAVKEEMLEVLHECRNTPHLGYVIVKWLGNLSRGAPLAKISAAIEKLKPVTTTTMLRVFLELLGNKRRDWALRVYHWVRYAKEPLTIRCLGQALASCEDPETMKRLLLDSDYESLTGGLESCFSGIIVVDGDEVKFSHDSFNQPMTFSTEENEAEQPSRIHGFIAEACLRYMTQDHIHQQWIRFSVDNYGGNELQSPLCMSEQGLLDYAIQFWVHHYKLAESHQPYELAWQLFQTKSFRNKWAEAYYLVSNPFTRIHRSYISPLPLMAAFGLEDMISSQVDQDRTSEWFEQDVWLAIVEAARNKHTSTLSNLLAYVKANESGLQDAMAWASITEDEDIMTELVGKMASLESINWTQWLLFRAAVTGSKCLAMAIAQAGFDLNGVDDQFGHTALHKAILWRNRGVVEVLLSFNVDISIADCAGTTPFILAIDMGDAHVVQLLLDKGARVDEKTPRGQRITMPAAFLGYHMVLERLLSAGAEFQTPDDDLEATEPTVICAAKKMRKTCVKMLLKHGADPHVQSSNGSLLYLCCRDQDFLEICRFLLDKDANPNERYPDKEMLLIAALRTNKTELVRLLIEKGAEINCLDPYEDADIGAKTPLSFTAAECSLEMIELLLEKGAEVNYAPGNSYPALFSAATGHFDTDRLKLFLDKGANIHWRRDDGRQAIHAAHDAPKSIQVLLERGADIRSMCYDGNVTMMAARWGCKDSLKTLVANQADLDQTFTYDPDDVDYGKTAIRLAAEAGYYDCASFLFESGAKLDDSMEDAKFFVEAINSAIPQKDLPALEKLIFQCFERGMKAGIVDEEGNTALHHTKHGTPVPLVVMLLGMGVPIDTPNADGWTPLAVALREGNVSVSHVLLSRGAQADIHSPKIGSLFHVVCGSLLKNPLAMAVGLLRRLIQHKADPSRLGPKPDCIPLLSGVARAPVHVYFRESITRYLVEEVKLDINSGGATGKYPLIYNTFWGNGPLVQYLIRKGADVEVADDQGLRASHHAARQIAMRTLWTDLIFKILIESGVELLPKDIYDRTPLHFAAGSGSWKHAKRLINQLPQGFNVDIKDSDGWTPLMWACRAEADETIQKLVQDYGADIWATSNDSQWSPLKLANLSGSGSRHAGLLEPSKDKMERVLEDGSKQKWIPDFHIVPPLRRSPSESRCSNCLGVQETEAVDEGSEVQSDANEGTGDDDEVDKDEGDEEEEEEEEDDDDDDDDDE